MITYWSIRQSSSGSERETRGISFLSLLEVTEKFTKEQHEGELRP